MADGGRVVVVTGLGGMGTAVAHRLGPGATLVLADVNPEALHAAAEDLRAEGCRVEEHPTDVSDHDAVAALAAAADRLGRVEAVVHTAGVSPVQASAEAVLRVDLLGTALMLDEFGAVIARGGAGVFIASMAGWLLPVDGDLERRLATTPTPELLALPELAPDALGDPGIAYSIAKRANHLRVRAASILWGRRGGRVNTISPGLISTPMGNAEFESEHGESMRAMLAMSPAGRVGTPHDIAGAAEFLTGPQSTFITGTDLLVDGGVVAAVSTGAR